MGRCAVLRSSNEDAGFASSKARGVVGKTVLKGNRVIDDCWWQALERIGTTEFSLDHVAYDPGWMELIVFSEAILDRGMVRA